MSRLLPLVLAPALVFAGAGDVRADLITITLHGAGFVAVGDTVLLTPRTFTLDLTLDHAVSAPLQSGEFRVYDSGWTNETFHGSLSRTVTVGGDTAELSQPLSLSITPYLDTLTISSGPTTYLDLDGVRRLEITPYGVIPYGTSLFRSSVGTTPFDLLGTFVMTTAPEPSSLVLSGLGLAGLLGYGWRRSARGRTSSPAPARG